MAYSVENIGGLLIRSKLLNAEQVKAMRDRWQKEGKDHLKSTPHYLKWIVANDYLTQYQAALIAHGHADNFFLGKYKILDRLGKGRMAGVYKALHQLGQVVAIKVLPPSYAKNAAMLARFEREARLAMKLKHPNVVRSFQVGEDGGLHYLVMEYVNGETLEDILQRRKKLPTNEAVRIVFQALYGLEHIHEKGLIHRDIKPANLMLTPGRTQGQRDTTLNSTVKILDIGLGREMFDESSVAAMQDLALTGEGVLLGTPDYLAPEQARDPRTIDIRADIYGLGCVLYHCLAGQPPFPDSNILNQILRHATEEAKPVKEFSPDVPDGLQQVLNWMMAKEADKRYPTPERAAKALQMFMVAGGKAQPLEDLPDMKRYLNWLESSEDGRKKEDTEGKKAAAVDKGDDEKTEANGKKKRAARKKRRRDSDRRRSKRRRHETPEPDEVDVELVAVPANGMGASVKKRSLLSLAPRDWFLLGAGAGAVIAAVLIGFLLSRLL